MEIQAERERKVKILFAGFCILLLLYLTVTALWQFVGAFFFTLLCYFGLKPVYGFLRSKSLGKTSSALLAILIGFILVGIPTVVFFSALLSQVTTLVNSGSAPGATIIQNDLIALQKIFPGIDLQGMLDKDLQVVATMLIGYFKDLVLAAIQDIGVIAIQSLVILFLLYYMLVWEEKLGKTAWSLLPFNQKNKKILSSEFNRITYSVLVASGLMGVIQAAPLTLALMFFNVPGALFLGFIAFIMTFIPFVGIPVVWIPVMVAEFAQGNTAAGLGLLVVGILLAILENARPLLQKNFGQIHPLISLLGVIAGVSLFGIMGVLIGPLMLSFALLGVRMFIEEYV